MSSPPSLPLRVQIALLAGVIAIAGALATSTLPGAVYALRDALFEASLTEPARAQLRAAEAQFGSCGPGYDTLRSQYGFDAWRLNYHLVVGVLGLSSALLMAVLAWWAAARVASPIEALARAARRVAAGERGVAAAPPPAAGAEVVALHADFARMTAALKAADDDLRLRSAALAHDIRTPLTIMKGRLIGLREQVFAPDAGFVDGLLQQVAFIDHLVSEVNALSDARAAQAAGSTAVDWSALTRQALAALQPEFQAAGIELQVDIDAGVVVQADSLRLNRALMNVLRNALRYAPGAPLCVSLRRQGPSAVLRCEDGGPGWPAGDPMMLAEPFARGEISRSADTGGNGLGLSIVQAVAVAYGGHLALLRGAAGGAVVELHLPRAVERDAP
ncbi:MAG: sensor histidine kinase [Rubrivivax sp.]|jgi:two-component system sensor histidine kinase AdeS